MAYEHRLWLHPRPVLGWRESRKQISALFSAGSFCSGLCKQFWDNFRYTIEQISMWQDGVENSHCGGWNEEGKKELSKND